VTTEAVKRQEELTRRQETVKLAAQKAETALDALKEHVAGLEREMKSVLGHLARYRELNVEEALEFLKEPWCILPKARDEYWVVVPKWVGVQVGWLERTTETYNIFVVNRYAHWFGNVPPEMRDTLKLPESFDATVEGGVLRTGAKLPREMSDHISKDLGGGEYKVKIGHEFDLMAQLIDRGALPFRAHPVDKADIRPVQLRGELATLRNYQVTAWDAFLDKGAVGVFWPWSAGKTVIAGYAIANLRGPKLVVVPTKTLIEQWDERLRKWLDLSLRSGEHHIDLITYNGYEKVRNKKYALTVFDECHRLPANTFSRLASISTKYRLGLSATPYREDGRTNYIIALTGWPVGVDWNEFIRTGIITKPHVEVRIVGGWNAKLAQVQAEVERTKGGKTLIFCDSLEMGARVATRLGCPHVHGQTDNRLKVIGAAKVSVVSRVGDEGLSLPDLQKVIEIDFLGSSRRQEGQRVGRLLHADKPGQHIVLMTQEEFDRFEGRFRALEEKGFKINVRVMR
jgi:DNA excision repair protein ERCC-3